MAEFSSKEELVRLIKRLGSNLSVKLSSLFSILFQTRVCFPFLSSLFISLRFAVHFWKFCFQILLLVLDFVVTGLEFVLNAQPHNFA